MSFFNIEIDENTESTTVNGWLIEYLGTIPEENCSFEYANLMITVTKADEMMSQEIKVEIIGLGNVSFQSEFK